MKKLTESERESRLRARKRKWYAANREKTLERSRKWHAVNREKTLENARKWYAANREKARENNRKWRAANLEKTRENARKWRAANREKTRDGVLKSIYGLQAGEYARILAAQNERCAICQAQESGGNSVHFHVDHCHRTGKVRGLLCFRCNLALGHTGDDLPRVRDWARRAVKYLKRSAI